MQQNIISVIERITLEYNEGISFLAGLAVYPIGHVILTVLGIK